MKNKPLGVTLMEVLIAFFLFNLFVLSSSMLIRSVLQLPYYHSSIHEWLSFMEEPLDQLSTKAPSDLKSWSVKWLSSSIPGYNLAKITTTSKSGKSLTWRRYIKKP